MLDAYIIERIRRERESRESGRRPMLEIPLEDDARRPVGEHDRRREDKPEGSERGVAIIDFTI